MISVCIWDVHIADVCMLGEEAALLIFFLLREWKTVWNDEWRSGISFYLCLTSAMIDICASGHTEFEAYCHIRSATFLLVVSLPSPWTFAMLPFCPVGVFAVWSLQALCSPSGRLAQPCPRGWWGHPICGPCNCDVGKGFDPDCNKTTGECRCKVGCDLLDSGGWGTELQVGI